MFPDLGVPLHDENKNQDEDDEEDRDEYDYVDAGTQLRQFTFDLDHIERQIRDKLILRVDYNNANSQLFGNEVANSCRLLQEMNHGIFEFSLLTKMMLLDTLILPLFKCSNVDTINVDLQFKFNV